MKSQPYQKAKGEDIMHEIEYMFSKDNGTV